MSRNKLMLAVSLAMLSSPAFASKPDTEAVEYYNTVIDHYFVTATSSEARAIDAGAAGPGWVRTGRTFQAWLAKATAPADAVPVCRFYSYAARSHFYTAGKAECEGLKRNGSGWTYEGIAFYIQAPGSGGCPAGTVELLRVYNDGFRTGQGANHRFVDDDALGDLMADEHWIKEGAVFCAAAKSTGTNADLPATASDFGAIEGKWRGDARWKVEREDERKHDDDERSRRAPLELAIAAGGAITGTGRGCTFTGQATHGDGFRAFFRASVTASGCEDPAFNGAYERVRLQRLGADRLKVRMKRDEHESEVSIDALLALEGGATPPPGSPGAPFQGEWTGTLQWEAEREGEDEDEEEVHANKSLTLKVDASGAVTGSGYGCTVAGTLNRTLTLTGCDKPIFNGTYAFRIEREGAGRIEVELKRESGGVEAEIEGVLKKVGATPPAAPPPAPPAPLTGAWSGEAWWMAGSASGLAPISFTIGSDGKFTGSLLGCTLAGTLKLAMEGRTVVSGTITASGCGNAALNGTFNDLEFERDGDALEAEFEREVNGVRVKLKVRVRRA